MSIPQLPFTGEQLRATLLALEEGKANEGPIAESGLTMGAGVLARADGEGAPQVYALGPGLSIVNGQLIVSGLGGAGAAYVFTQSTPAAVWTINHNLGYRPSVELFNAGSQEIDGEVAHPSVNQTIVTLNPATAGQARLI